MLASTLGIEFDPDAAWNERKKVYETSNLIIGSTSITAYSEGDRERALDLRCSCGGVPVHLIAPRCPGAAENRRGWPPTWPQPAVTIPIAEGGRAASRETSVPRSTSEAHGHPNGAI